MWRPSQSKGRRRTKENFYGWYGCCTLDIREKIKKLVRRSGVLREDCETEEIQLLVEDDGSK
jgi:hypothetical protein